MQARRLDLPVEEASISIVSPVDRIRALHIGMLGTYPPRLCGLATFGAALERELVRAGERVTVIAIGDGRPGRTGRAEPTHLHELHNGDVDSVLATAWTLSQCDVAIVQHEYGIYGGVDGDELVDVLNATEAPVIVVLHTVLRQPTPHQRSVLETVCDLAAHVVVMTATAGARLRAGYAVDDAKVTTIPHGALSPGSHPEADHGSCRTHLVTWGLLGPGKGVEHMIGAMALLGDLAPRIRYTVAGATHPNVLARDGDQYRESLIRQAWVSGVARSVRFDETYRDLPALLRFVTSASLVVLPYDSVDQVTSGVLVDAIAAGVPVIATAFPHAVELLSDGAGLLVPHRDPTALAAAVRNAVTEPGVLQAMTARAREIAPTLTWATVAAQYVALCESLGSTAAVAGATG